MLLPINGKSILHWAWKRTRDHFGFDNTIIAAPRGDEELEDAATDAMLWYYDGPEWDVLGRFHACAHAYRKNPQTVIYRITPDDFPVELEREAFLLEDLDRAQETVAPRDKHKREHMALALFGYAPKTQAGTIEINTQADYEEVLCRTALTGASSVR